MRFRKVFFGLGSQLTSYVKLSVGYTGPEEGLIEAVREASAKRLQPKAGAPILSIPAAANVWMKEQLFDLVLKYSTYFVSPEEMPNKTWTRFRCARYRQEYG